MFTFFTQAVVCIAKSWSTLVTTIKSTNFILKFFYFYVLLGFHFQTEIKKAQIISKPTLKYFNLLVISLAVICLTEIKILLILKKLAFFFSSLLLIIRLRASLHESFRPGINSSRCLVIFLLLFTWWYSTAERSNVCQNSSRDETHLGSHVKRPLILDSWNALKPSMSIFGAFVS